MRIYGTNGPTAPGSKPAARRTSSGTFVLPGADSGQQTAPAAPAGNVAGIEALIALQGIEDPAERRRRAVTRGRSALDALDELKLALLSGAIDVHILNRLKVAAAALKESTGDPMLDAVLAEIELRAEVELAKMTPLLSR
ncbi:MAG: flagellar assembly protein FliX [Xanthobacteraceae bacterium]